MKYAEKVVETLTLCHHMNGKWIGYADLRIEFSEKELFINSPTQARICVRTKLENCRAELNAFIDGHIERLK